MQVDVLIVGQGICGTLLSWFLHKEGKRFIVLDDDRPNSSSQAAAGIINPVTGRRYVYSWMIDTVMPFAIDTYTEMGTYLDMKTISTKSIIDFFPTPQMRDAFVTRITEDDTYIHSYPDQNSFNPHFNYDFGCGEVQPAYLVYMQGLLAAWRQKLTALEAIRSETFVMADLKMRKEGIQYGDITAEKIIFCNGIAAATGSPFELLPFSLNKGEALLIECSHLPTNHIFKKGLMLAPMADGTTFWAGSNYQWEFADDRPSQPFYDSTKKALQHWLKVPFNILEHKAAVRPATLERRPFVGFHPQLESVGIFNGMGTKGASLAPFFANQLVQHIVHGFPVMDEVNVRRFNRILSK